MLTDAAALVATLTALRLARRPASGAWTFGLKRAEVLSAQANGVTLLVVSALIAFEAIHRLMHPSNVTGSIVIVVAAVGMVVNGAATWSLGKANRESLNIKGAFEHIFTDLVAFAATLIAGIVIVATGYRRADSIASLFVVFLMLRSAWGLLRETGRVLLEAAPAEYDPEIDCPRNRRHPVGRVGPRRSHLAHHERIPRPFCARIGGRTGRLPRREAGARTDAPPKARSRAHDPSSRPCLRRASEDRPDSPGVSDCD